MKVLASIVAIAIATFLLVVVAYVGYWAVRDLMEGYPLLELSTRATLAGIAASALVLGLVVAAGLRSAARLQLQGRLVESRRDLYRRVLAVCLPLVEHTAGRPSVRTSALRESLTALGPDLVLVGGPAVIKAHVALRAAVERVDGTAEIESRLGELLREMRRELGHPATFEESRLAWLALVTADHGPGQAEVAMHSGSR